MQNDTYGQFLVIDNENEPREPGRYIKKSDLLNDDFDKIIFLGSEDPLPPCGKNDHWVNVPLF